jgi:hypothetical protein
MDQGRCGDQVHAVVELRSIDLVGLVVDEPVDQPAVHPGHAEGGGLEPTGGHQLLATQGPTGFARIRDRHARNDRRHGDHRRR